MLYHFNEATLFYHVIFPLSLCFTFLPDTDRGLLLYKWETEE